MTNQSAPLIDPLLPPQWDEAALDALGAFPKSLQFVLDRWREGGVDARGMHALGTLAHYPALTKAFMTLNAHVAGNSTLPVRQRELAILRISWLRRQEYEFVQHIILGRRAGVTDEELRRLEIGADAAGWSTEEQMLLRAVDELHADARIARETFLTMKQHFEIKQLLDLIFLVGCYDTLGMALNSFEVQLEPGVTPLDPTVRARMFAPR
jgi:4-carboxymuconolactone decarboxylase